ncbi:hypothetical protein ACFRDV_22255 [Streptomyces fagopyri]|uniref:hypothetical protein n=1 Tax=Streptomyces fagopyri TaxID=2662397 RepID=UPI0036A60924
MPQLEWRTADVVLRDKLIPDPRNESQLLDRLTQVKVAVDTGFLHIDPRRNGDVAFPGADTFSAYIVPAHQVLVVTYQAPVNETPETPQVF